MFGAGKFKGVNMKFNKDQREGFAKIADNLATTSMVGLIIGGLVDHKIDITAGASLVILFFLLLFIGYRLRREDEQNGN